jgi:hypothetical protein
MRVLSVIVDMYVDHEKRLVLVFKSFFQLKGESGLLLVLKMVNTMCRKFENKLLQKFRSKLVCCKIVFSSYLLRCKLSFTKSFFWR